VADYAPESTKPATEAALGGRTELFPTRMALAAVANEAEIHTGQIIHRLKSHRAASYFKRSSTSDENVTARTGDMQHERWRILCRRAAKEQDLERLLQLVQEMNRLLIKRLLQADVSIAAAGRNLRGRMARS
jgi:hypothetical protein